MKKDKLKPDWLAILAYSGLTLAILDLILIGIMVVIRGIRLEML